jgi:arylsulfatase
MGMDSVPTTPIAFYSIDETFDVGIDTGSPAGLYPKDTAPGFAIRNVKINTVKIDLR